MAESILMKLASTLTRFMLRCTRLGWRVASIPKTSTSPLSGRTSVEITRTSVLFPLPLGPRMPTTSPFPTESEIESRARTTSPRRFLKLFSTPLNSRAFIRTSYRNPALRGAHSTGAPWPPTSPRRRARSPRSQRLPPGRRACALPFPLGRAVQGIARISRARPPFRRSLAHGLPGPVPRCSASRCTSPCLLLSSLRRALEGLIPSVLGSEQKTFASSLGAKLEAPGPLGPGASPEKCSGARSSRSHRDLADLGTHLSPEHRNTYVRATDVHQSFSPSRDNNIEDTLPPSREIVNDLT